MDPLIAIKIQMQEIRTQAPTKELIQAILIQETPTQETLIQATLTQTVTIKAQQIQAIIKMQLSLLVTTLYHSLFILDMSMEFYLGQVRH